MSEYQKRRDDLAIAIRKTFFNQTCNCFGSISNLRGMGWVLWPSELLFGNETAILDQAEALYRALTPFLNNVPGVYSYVQETALILAKVWVPRNMYKARLLNLAKAIARVATPTFHFGENYLLSQNGEWQNLNNIPHVWEGVLMYQFLMQVFQSGK